MKKFNIKRLIKLFYSFLSSKKSFKIPNKKDILIYDNANSYVIKNYINNISYHILYIRWEYINVSCLFLSIFNSSFWQFNFAKAYEDTIIRFVKPKIAITLMDNNKNFYRLSDDYENLITISIQNGWRNQNDIFFSPTNKNKLKVDYLFVFGSGIAKKYRNVIKGKIIVAGSIKNNHINEIEDKFKYDPNNILFISSYRFNSGNVILYDDSGLPINWHDLYKYELQLIHWLSEWCLTNKKKLIICPRYQNNNLGEYSWYKKILQKNKVDWDFYPKNNPYSSYQAIEKSDIIVSTPSTLGYEALSRGKKTAFLITRGELIGNKGLRFGWPLNLSDTGHFWSNKPNKNEFSRVMNYLNTISEEDWKLLWSRYKDDLIYFEKGNSKFRQIIDKIRANNNIK